MSHADTITKIPDGYNIIASTGDIKVGAFSNQDQTTFGLQFSS